jgi:ribosome-binding protein aMBF1 (putative translation factor)
MTPGPNPESDPKTAAALTAAHTAYLDGRDELARLSKERRAKVVWAHEKKGWSEYMIAKHLGIHANVVRAILDAAKKGQK